MPKTKAPVKIMFYAAISRYVVAQESCLGTGLVPKRYPNYTTAEKAVAHIKGGWSGMFHNCVN